MTRGAAPVRRAGGLAVLLVMFATLGCAPASPDPAPRRLGVGAGIDDTAPAPDAPSRTDAAAPDAVARSVPAAAASERPAWLGTRVLERGDDGFGVRLPTPPELIDRRFAPPAPHPTLPPPPSDGTFVATVTRLDAATTARSTWHAGCPVPLDELRHVTLVHVGFDGRTHTGELIVHEDVTDDVIAVFGALHAARFPLEEVRIITADELGLPPTGDGNVTTGFVCRAMVAGTRWSEHAFGRAIDVNPFHNPYVRGDVVLPELASAYLERTDLRPGMIVAGDVVTAAFEAVGWRWGGTWSSGPDWMHFSTSGR
jgi:hypothetical protein